MDGTPSAYHCYKTLSVSFYSTRTEAIRVAFLSLFEKEKSDRILCSKGKEFFERNKSAKIFYSFSG